MQSKIIHLAEVGSRSNDVGTVFEEKGAQSLYKGVDGDAALPWRYLRVELFGNRFPRILFLDFHNLGRLQAESAQYAARAMKGLTLK